MKGQICRSLFIFMQNEQNQQEQTQGVKAPAHKKLFKKNKTVAPVGEVQRFHALASEGLSPKQVQQRIEQGLVNTAPKKYSSNASR